MRLVASKGLQEQVVFMNLIRELICRLAHLLLAICAGPDPMKTTGEVKGVLAPP